MKKSKEEDQLNKNIAKQLEQIQLLEELDSSMNKCALDKSKEMSVETFTTKAHGITTKKGCNSNEKDNHLYQST